MPCSRGSGDPKGETHVRRLFIHRHPRVYPPARASAGHDSCLRSRTIQPRLKIVASALSREFQAQNQDLLNEKTPRSHSPRGPDGPHVLLRSIYLMRIEVVDKPSDSHRPCDQLPARNRAPTGVWPPFSQLAAGWRLDWGPPSFAGPFFSIAVAIFAKPLPGAVPWIV